MSDDTKVNIEVKEEPKPSRAGRLRRWIGERIAGEPIYPERIEREWDRIYSIGGFLPIYKEGRLELRTVKQEKALEKIRRRFMSKKVQTFEDLKKAMYKSIFEVFALFFTTGTQWLGGLSDRETAKKVSQYLEFFQRSSDNLSFVMDLFTVSMQMINITWKPEDVGSLPPYLIETKTVIQPTQQRGVSMDEVKEY